MEVTLKIRKAKQPQHRAAPKIEADPAKSNETTTIDEGNHEQVDSIEERYLKQVIELEAKVKALEDEKAGTLPPELANMFAPKTPARGGGSNLPFLGRVDPVERSYGPELTEREANMPNQWQQAIWLQAEPIMRKIASNPKALLIYARAREAEMKST